MRQWLALGALLAGLALFFALGGGHVATFDYLSRHRATLIAEVDRHKALAALVYILAYVALAACSIPGALAMTLFGGFLFGPALGTACAAIGATIGATILFLVARSTLGATLRSRAGPWLARMRRGFQANAASYLLVLRLVPLFPFWLVNLVPACLGMDARAFALATFFGILPATAVYAFLGAGLGQVLDAGRAPAFDAILEPRILLPLLGLAILALVPVVYKGLKVRRR
ncbi:MAG TPA: VTT domain-containing protein [Alphaproteobacteria bacterium]|nr:VTT domain-containing protein [Alphaproteobacteria bacterium]